MIKNKIQKNNYKIYISNIYQWIFNKFEFFKKKLIKIINSILRIEL